MLGYGFHVFHRRDPIADIKYDTNDNAQQQTNPGAELEELGHWSITCSKLDLQSDIPYVNVLAAAGSGK